MRSGGSAARGRRGCCLWKVRSSMYGGSTRRRLRPTSYRSLATSSATTHQWASRSLSGRSPRACSRDLGKKHRAAGTEDLGRTGEGRGNTAEYFSLLRPSSKWKRKRGAVEAGRQLDQDVVDMIRSINKERTAFNELVMGVAKDATGHDGKTPKEWRQKLAGKGFSKPLRSQANVS